MTRVPTGLIEPPVLSSPAVASNGAASAASAGVFDTEACLPLANGFWLTAASCGSCPPAASTFLGPACVKLCWYCGQKLKSDPPNYSAWGSSVIP